MKINKYINKSINKILLFGFIVFCAIVLVLSVRGLNGNPSGEDLNTPRWLTNGPFELSPERGRFALTYNIIENKSFYFSKPIAQFAAPDVGFINGHYVSLFAPLVSYVIIPGYLLGKIFGISQVGAFAAIALFALLNVLLLRLIAIRMGAEKLPATIASLVFLFATPAFTYAVSLYQHHISTFLILLSLYVLLKTKRIWGLFVVFFLCALAIPLDYPNAFFMFPIGLYALGRIIYFREQDSRNYLSINFAKLMTILIVVIPLLFFLWFNKSSYGNPFQLSGTVKTAVFSKEVEKKDLNSIITKKNDAANTKKSKSAVNFFKTRNLLNGFYIHFTSPDRGIIYYAPVVLFGFIGMYFALKKKVKMSGLLISVMGANILLYSMWGDPWGGWAFGSRYLIPSYAILSIFIALLLTYFRKKIIFITLFLVIAFYSVAINTLGAITTSAIPPKVEVLALEKISHTVQRYNYLRNWEFLNSGSSKSFVYQTYLEKYISSVLFFEILTVSICFLIGAITIYYYFISRKEIENV